MTTEEDCQADLMRCERTRLSPDSVLVQQEPVLQRPVSDHTTPSQAEVSGRSQKEIGRGKKLVLANKKQTENQKRALPSVGAFTVQCSLCLKWRLIPTKEQYEEIRHRILEEPWECRRAASWRPNASCDDPADLSQDRTRVWAIDKPNIPRPPPGWDRLTVIRGAGSSKFADIYYVEPSGKKLRSIPDVERFLVQHPEYAKAGVTLDQFSFMSPVPLDKHYTKKLQNKVVKPKNSIIESRRLFQPISAKQRAERAVARRKNLAEILAGGQSKLQHNGQIDMQTIEGNNFDESAANLAIIPVQLPNYLPTAELPPEKSEQGECARVPGFEVLSNDLSEFSGNSRGIEQRSSKDDPVSTSLLASEPAGFGCVKSEQNAFGLS